MCICYLFVKHCCSVKNLLQIEWMLFVVVCSVLASLNLPAAIEDLSGSGGVPQSVLDKAAAVRETGGAAALNRLINELPVLLQRNKEILDEARLLFFWMLSEIYLTANVSLAAVAFSAHSLIFHEW